MEAHTSKANISYSVSFGRTKHWLPELVERWAPSNYFATRLRPGCSSRNRMSRGKHPFGPNSKRILDFAAEEAGALGQSQITLGHYLLGILRVEECIASKVLQAHG